jgi:hypothetical protein
MSSFKERLITPVFLMVTAVAMTAWLGLIGYGAWHFLFG